MIKPLTSLRFFFALMVFGAHCYTIDPYFEHLVFKEGFVGVNFFFILSGFIIAYNYQKKIEERRTTNREFWIARIARIYPLHLLTLVISVLLGGYLASGGWDWLKHFIANLFLLQPYIPKMDYFFSFNSPSWSLGCEQLFYFLFPLLAVFFAKSKRLIICMAIITAVMIVGIYFTPEENIRAYWYVNPLTRLPDFLIGMLLYRVYDKYRHVEWSPSKASLYEIGAIILFLAFYIPAPEFIPKVLRYSLFYWIPISVMLFVFAKQSGILSKVLSNKYLVIGGEISFSIYLIHLFIINGYLRLSAADAWNIPWEISIPAIFIITVGVSLLSYYYFEKPANHAVKRLLKKKK